MTVDLLLCTIALFDPIMILLIVLITGPHIVSRVLSTSPVYKILAVTVASWLAKVACAVRKLPAVQVHVRTVKRCRLLL
jgi:hypothetical protein